MTRVGVSGAAGRMGRTICAAVAADPDLALVAAVDPGGAGEEIAGVSVAAELHAFADADCEVVIDFSIADAARNTLPWLGMHGMHAVVGTTGFTDVDLVLFETTFGGAGPNCVIAPNFAISAVLMMRFAAMAAPFFETAEIVEYHHNRKIDAPSGTALKTAEMMAAARDTDFGPDPTEHETPVGIRSVRADERQQTEQHDRGRRAGGDRPPCAGDVPAPAGRGFGRQLNLRGAIQQMGEPMVLREVSGRPGVQ